MAEHCSECRGQLDYKVTLNGQHLYWCPACRRHVWVDIKSVMDKEEGHE